MPVTSLLPVSSITTLASGQLRITQEFAVIPLVSSEYFRLPDPGSIPYYINTQCYPVRKWWWEGNELYD